MLVRVVHPRLVVLSTVCPSYWVGYPTPTTIAECMEVYTSLRACKVKIRPCRPCFIVAVRHTNCLLLWKHVINASLLLQTRDACGSTGRRNFSVGIIVSCVGTGVSGEVDSLSSSFVDHRTLFCYLMVWLFPTVQVVLVNCTLLVERVLFWCFRPGGITHPARCIPFPGFIHTRPNVHPLQYTMLYLKHAPAKHTRRYTEKNAA